MYAKGENMAHARARDGFTLIEILIALTIVGILAAAGFAGMTFYTNWAKRVAVEQTLGNLKVLVDNYERTMGDYPNSLQDLVRPPAGAEDRWHSFGPYWDKGPLPKDTWKRQYKYQLTPGGAHEYELYSEGDPKQKGKARIDVWRL